MRCCSFSDRNSYDHSIVARSVCCRGSASRPPVKRSSRCARPLEDLLRREHARAGGGELERQRQVVEPPAELVDGRGSASRRRDRRRASPLRARRAASPRTRPRPRTRSSSREVTSRRELRAALHEHRPGSAPPRPPAPGCRERAASPSRRCVRRDRPLPRAPVRPREAPAPCRGATARPTQNTPALNSPTSSAAASIASRVFPEPPGPGQRHQARPGRGSASPTSLTSRSRPTKLDAGRGQVRVRDRLQRRKGAVPELEDRAPASSKSFSRCSPRSRTSTVDERARRPGEQHLPAVASAHHRGPPGARPAPTYFGGSRPGVPVCMPTRILHRPVLERRLRLLDRRDRSRRRSERVEERVTLVVDLVAAVAAERRLAPSGDALPSPPDTPPRRAHAADGSSPRRP